MNKKKLIFCYILQLLAIATLFITIIYRGIKIALNTQLSTIQRQVLIVQTPVKEIL